MSQTAFAARVGTTQQRISFWESAKALPDVDAILSMARVLGVPAGWLAFGEGAQ